MPEHTEPFAGSTKPTGVNRRQFIVGTAAVLAGSAIHKLESAPMKRNKRLGIARHSYVIRWGSTTSSTDYPAFSNALDLLEHCGRIGAGGLQVGVGGWETDFAGTVRDRREALGLYLEGQIRLPRSAEDVARFEHDIQMAKETGVTIFRTACLSGRRYETFDSLEAFEAFRKEAWTSLERAEPVAGRHRVKIAVENHKDWRVPDMIDLLRHLDSEWIGVTLDTGNSISLLEDPMEVVEGLAPYAFTTHIKDMAVAEYEDGFLLSEVPLGAGFLDLKRMIEICEQHNPEITWNLEMITRDPLKIPCLTDRYWATFETLHGSELARMLRTVRQQDPGEPPPGVTGKNPEQRLAFEEENILSSIAYAEQNLGMTG